MVNDRLNYTNLIEKDSKKLETTISEIKASGKKVATLYGNCHMEVLASYLIRSAEFLEKYCIIEIPVIFDMKTAGVSSLDEFFLKNLDLLIYQNIGEDNKFGPQWATDRIINGYVSDCKRICVPNTVFLGYFPQEGKRHNTIIKNQVNFVPMFCGDKYIDREYQKTHSIKQTIMRLKDPDYVIEKELKNNLMMSFRLLEMQDMGCNVPMRDFVINNYKKICLFTEPKHPVNLFFHEMTDRVLALLGMKKLKDVSDLDALEGLSTINRLFYPAVVKGLDLNFIVQEYYIDKRITTQKFSFEEYIELYIRNTSIME